jgi:pyridoxine 4-dehydrogenase
MLTIPGTSSIGHLEENVAAAGLILTPEDITALDEIG